MSGPTPPAPTRLQPAEGQVIIRMYRQGLGDCFLLAFPDGAGHAFYVLIDCGVIKGTKAPADRLRAVAADIREATGGHVHVLVATHEHWDHLSGFLDAQDIFKTLTVDAVWLAWTEDESDELANTLRKHRAARVAALQATVARLQKLEDTRSLTPGHEGTRERIQSLLDFFGDVTVAPAGAGAQGLAVAPADAVQTADRTTQAALLSLRHGRDAANNDVPRAVRYCRPGEAAIDLPVDGGVRVYVLGPPHDAGLIRRSDPTRSGREVYELSLYMTEETAFAAAAESGSGSGATMDDEAVERFNRSFPFDKCYHVQEEQAKAGPSSGFFREYYGFGQAGAESWRRIDDDWLETAGPLALQLDSDTNNTSLALAFEIGKPGTGKVLLFPADAQVGNWLSWQQYSWPETPAAGERPVTATDLLGRTVLYKVGHHGSHNATLRALGLELMTSPDLVAMIPVSQAMAEKKKWAMPFTSLYETLKKKTRGRIMRVDDGWEGDGWQDEGRRGDGRPPQPWGDGNPRWGPLYIEYTIKTEETEETEETTSNG